jgi:hypothetical protein
MRTERDVNPASSALASLFAAVRALTAAGRAALRRRCDDPVDGRCVARQMASRAHDLVLRDLRAARSCRGLPLFDERWPFLFNSYYEAEGQRHARPRRGMLSRPSLDEILAYREARRYGVAGGLARSARGRAEPGCARLPSRGAASGTAAHRHPPPFLGESARACDLAGAPKVPVAMPGPIGWLDRGAAASSRSASTWSRRFRLRLRRPAPHRCSIRTRIGRPHRDQRRMGALYRRWRL